jgi:hypothetical protein
LLLLTIHPAAAAAFGQPPQGGDDRVLAGGIPPLTLRMAERLIYYYGYMLNLKLTPERREQFRRLLVSIWEEQNFERMGELLVKDEEAIQLAAVATDDYRSRLRAQLQEKVLSALRAQSDPFAKFLVAAYDETRQGGGDLCPQPERVAAPDAAIYRALKTGRYEGAATNKTAGFGGKAALDVRSVDAQTGKVNADFYLFAGLEAEAKLTGAFDERGVLFLSGAGKESDRVCVQAQPAGDSIKGGFSFEAAVPEAGEFRGDYKGEAAAAASPLRKPWPPLLIGLWQRDDWTGRDRQSQMSPNLNTSYSTRWTLEFFDDGHYKLIQTTRLCPAGGTCCRNNNSLEVGVFTIQGEEGFAFTFKSGDVMHTDECNPGWGGVQPMRPAEATLQGRYKWALGPNPETKVLTHCFKKGDGTPVCMERRR